MKMALNLDIKEAFKYPLRQWKRLTVMGLLEFPGCFLIIPIFLVNGYTVRTAEELLKGNKELPEIKNWSYLLKKGIGAIAVLLECILLILLTGFTAYVLVLIFTYIGTLLGSIVETLVTIIALLTLIPLTLLILLALSATPVMIIHYAKKGKFTAGLEIQEIYYTLRAGVIGFITATGITLLFDILEYPAMILLPIYGIICFYFKLVTLHLYTQLYKKKEGNPINQTTSRYSS